MTTTTLADRGDAPARMRRPVIALAAGTVIAGLATTAIALTAQSLGAGDFPALKPLVYLPFVVLGLAAAVAGWAIVRARAKQPAPLLRILVPMLTLLSLIPDVVLAVTGFIPGTTITGAVALMTMHLTVVGVIVPVLTRVLPVD